MNTTSSRNVEIKRVRRNALGDAEIEALLARKTSAVIAFVDGRGYPRMVPCWFLWWEGAFYTTSLADKFHVRSIRNNPRGSFCIEVEDVTPQLRSNRQVKGVGQFELIETDADLWMGRIREKYLGTSDSTPVFTEDRVVVKLIPEKLTAHGGDIILSPSKGTV